MTIEPALFDYCDTERQREVLKAVVAHGGIRPAARVLGVQHSTIQRLMQRVERKAAKGRPDSARQRPVAEPLPPAREMHDAAFWRKKATASQRQIGELEHLAEQLSGVRGVPYQMPEYAVTPSSGRSQSVIGCYFSDVHMGEVIAADEIHGINQFNSDICRQRMRRYVNAACNIGLRWSSDTDCVGAYLGLGGDLISGDIHEELRMTNDLTAHEQVQAMVEEVGAAIRHLKEAFGRVHVTCVPGNHGRNTPKSTAKLYSRLSYDMMIGAMVQREFENDPRVTFQMSAAKDQVTPIFGRNVLNTHGDKMGTGGGQGFAGPMLPIVRGTKKIQAQYASMGVKLDTILHGHYHISGNPNNVLSNGSVPGYSEYADDLRVVVEPPQQNLFLMHSRWGLRERMPIQLEEPAQPVKPRVRVPAWDASN